MTRSTILAFAAGAAAVGGSLFLTGLGPDDGHAEHSDPKGEHAAMTPEQEMEMWMAMATPGEHHAHFNKSIGEWTAKTSFVMDPASPPMEGTGTMRCEWVMGKRFVKCDFHMDDMMGMPFDGLAYSGYDNVKGAYVSTWMDTMGTGITYMTGELDAETLVMQGKTVSPSGPTEMKIVTTWKGDDQFTDVFYDRTEGGEWHKSGEIAYYRR